MSRPPLERLAYTMSEAAAVIGVSPDFFADHVRADLRIVRKGRLKLVSKLELERWLEQNSTLTIETEEAA